MNMHQRSQPPITRSAPCVQRPCLNETPPYQYAYTHNNRLGKLCLRRGLRLHHSVHRVHHSIAR